VSVAGDGVIVFDHIAVGVPDPSELVPLVVSDWGGEEYEAGPGGGFSWYQWQFANGGLLEVLEPAGPPGGFLHRFLEAHGRGVHHVTFKVPSHAATLQRAHELGYTVVGVNDSDPGWKEAFLHPKQAQGIVVQIVESGGSDEAESPSAEWSLDFPPAPDPAGNPIDLVGLRMVTRDADRARTQWETLLGAECEARDDTLVFRWPGSPMRISVEVDASRPEGPIGVEVARAAEANPAVGAHPLLGTAILTVTPDTK
jgi:methylmalonyl-CoA/ethylmalonyl-CoA epimerase